MARPVDDGERPAKARAASAPAKKTAKRKAPAATKTAGAKMAGAKKKAAPKKAVQKKTTAKKTAAKTRAGRSRGANDERAMLIEQNEALRSELEEAKARIARLEDLHGEVINRIDWVIDSLQTVLEEKS